MPSAVHKRNQKIVGYLDFDRFDHYFFTTQNKICEKIKEAVMIQTQSPNSDRNNTYTFVNHNHDVIEFKDGEVIFISDGRVFVLTDQQFNDNFNKEVF